MGDTRIGAHIFRILTAIGVLFVLLVALAACNSQQGASKPEATKPAPSATSATTP